MDIGPYIDYTLLKLTAKTQDLPAFCSDAIDNNYKAVCVQPHMVGGAALVLGTSSVTVCSVVGFPFGYHYTETKMNEADLLIDCGAREIDMVANLSAFFGRHYEFVKRDILAVAEVCHEKNALLKVIVESGLLNKNQIHDICNICMDAGVDFVKTSTGFAQVHAEIDKVKLMRSILPSHIQIKASGGIKTYEDAVKFIEAGATRIGTSTLIKNVPA